MGKLETALKDEISRIAKKQTKALLEKHVDDIRKLKQRVAELQGEVVELKKARAQEDAHLKMQTASTSDQKVRVSASQIKKLRTRLKISQPELALLLDVSPAAVGFWETGKANPRDDKKTQIAALRSLGLRDVKRLLEAKKTI